MTLEAQKPRMAYLTDPNTSRDIFGVCRGRCNGCADCGKYLKRTAEYTVGAGEQGRRHPDNDLTITRCSRCGCPPEAHAVEEHEQARKAGNDAFALGRYDSAVAHYSRALALCAPDASLWSNRAAAYLAKGWGDQALADAEHALSLRPDWAKAWGRKAAALLQLGRAGAAAEAYQRGLQLEPGNAALREGWAQAQQAQRRQQQQQQQQQQERQKTVRQQHPAPAAPARSSRQAAAQTLRSALDVHSERCATADAAAGGAFGSMSRAQSSGGSAAGIAAAGGPLPAAWGQLCQQAEAAAAAVATLQRQMQHFEELLLLHNVEQPSQPAEHPASLDHPDSMKHMEQAPAAAQAGSGEVQAAASASGDAAAVNGLPTHPDINCAAAAAAAAAAPAAEHSECSWGGGDSGADAGSEDDGIEEVYSELPGAPDPGSLPRETRQKQQQRVTTSGAAPLPAGTSSQSCRTSSSTSSDGGSATACGGSSASSTDGDSDGVSDSAANAWLAGVEAARRQLAEAGEGLGLAVPPSTGRRQPRSSQQASAAGVASGLGLGSLRQMCADAEAAALAKDAGGVAWAACRRCGSAACPRFRPAGTAGEAAAVAAMLEQQALAGSSAGAYLGALQSGCSSLCASCGCASSVHETSKEAAAREARQRRQQQRLEREQQQRAGAQSGGGTAAAAAGMTANAGMQPEAEEDRQRRLAAAEGRRTAAAAAGEQLQESDCDVLSQQKRGGCGGCTACPGFRILFRSRDANDPEVMFFCSACGCRADQHAVDAGWQAQEAQRRRREAAAAERRQAAAGAAAAAAAGVRQAEAEAYAALGLSLGADAKSVSRAYKRLALQLHPDKQQQAAAAGPAAAATGPPCADPAAVAAAAAAKERFIRVAAAYRLLTERGGGGGGSGGLP